MTIVDKERCRSVRFARRQIACEGGNMRLRCGKCGGMDFEVHVLPACSVAMAQVKELVCLGCLKVRKIDGRGFIDSLGKVDAPSLVDDWVAPMPSDIRAEEVRKSNDNS